MNVRTLAPFCDLGTTGAPFQTIHLSGNVRGIVNNRACDDIVSNTGTSTAGNLSVFSSSSGKVIEDSGTALSSLATQNDLQNLLSTSGGTMFGPIDMNNNDISNVQLLNGRTADEFVRNPNAAAPGRIAVFGGDSVTITDSGVLATAVVQGPASAVLNRVAVFSNTSGKLLADSGSTLSQYALLTGATFTGAITCASIAFSTSGVIGTTTNNDAAAGSVGQLIEANIGTVGLTTGVSANIGSISLTAGDWDVFGVAEYKGAGAITSIQAGINTTSATIPNTGLYVQFNLPFTAGTNQDIPIPIRQISIPATTTVYLVTKVSFSAGAIDTYGYLAARRRR